MKVLLSLTTLMLLVVPAQAFSVRGFAPVVNVGFGGVRVGTPFFNSNFARGVNYGNMGSYGNLAVTYGSYAPSVAVVGASYGTPVLSSAVYQQAVVPSVAVVAPQVVAAPLVYAVPQVYAAPLVVAVPTYASFAVTPVYSNAFYGSAFYGNHFNTFGFRGGFRR